MKTTFFIPESWWLSYHSGIPDRIFLLKSKGRPAETLLIERLISNPKSLTLSGQILKFCFCVFLCLIP